MPKYTINTYAFQVDSNSVQTARKALIFCRDSGTLRGWLTFYDDSIALPPPSLDKNERITLTYPMSQLGTVMDLFRNEKPLHIYYFSPTFAGLSSSGEPVGEEET